MTPVREAVAALVLAFVVAGCGSTGDDASGVPVAGSTAEAGDGAGTSDACTLLTDDEIDATMGAHDPGEQDLAYGGCFWRLDKESDRRLGLYVTVLNTAEYESLAEEGGVPIDDLGVPATYHELYGQLWFDCGDDRHCGVIHAYDPPEQARADVIELAQLVQHRIDQ